MGSKARTVAIKDHNDEKVVMAWVPKRNSRDADDLPPFGFQVYLTSEVQHPNTVTDVAILLADAFFHHLTMPERCEYRLDVYSRPQSTALGCMAHARQEVWHRNRNGIWPRLVSDWEGSRDRGSCSCFVILVDNTLWPSNSFMVGEFCLVSRTQGVRQAGMQDPDTQDVNLFTIVDVDTWQEFCRVLRAKWTEAGGTWTQEDLRRRNQGGFSPALYPAVDPAAHFDANFDDSLVGADDTGAGADEHDSAVRQNTLIPPGKAQLEWSTYTDLSGCQVLSMWHRSWSRTQPLRTLVVYLSHLNEELPSTSPILMSLIESLLPALGRRPWRLDILTSFHSLAAAYTHFTREVPQRSLSSTESRQQMFRWLLAKINANRLPGEILEMIETFLVPPAIVPYLLQPVTTDIEKLTFLYLDNRKPQGSPLAVRWWWHHSPRPTLLQLMADGQFSEPPPYEGVDKLTICDTEYWRIETE